MKNFSRELETYKKEFNELETSVTLCIKYASIEKKIRWIFSNWKLKTEIKNLIDEFFNKVDTDKGLDIFWDTKWREFLISRPTLKEILKWVL